MAFTSENPGYALRYVELLRKHFSSTLADSRHFVAICSDGRLEERAEFLARAAQSDPSLCSKLQALLDAHAENRSFMESPVMRVSLSPQFGGWQTHIMESLVPTSINPMTGQMIGRLLDGKYRLEELIGRGGMGAVYSAMHVGTGRRVAVKVIAPELAGKSEFIERFRREAKTIGRLRHPNIVNVTDFGITGENEQTLAYLVMERLEGVTLAVKLKDKRPLPLADALDILSQTCEAIDEAHRLGILHRDLKPENIWLEPVGVGGCNVKVLDFGIAQLHDFKGTAAELLDQHREAAPAPLSKKRGDIPSTLDAVVRQALAKEPSARPATAGAFAFLMSLQLKGNDSLRQQADAINRRKV
jgi:tRNA A-37 threonylcarbamoyl transferase component Bud32